jgi:hypothetical protein
MSGACPAGAGRDHEGRVNAVDNREVDRVSDQTQARPLHELVAGELPAGIASLSAADQDALAAVLTQVRTAQRQELKDAANSLLDLVPGFLRGAVKRAAGL